MPDIDYDTLLISSTLTQQDTFVRRERGGAKELINKQLSSVTVSQLKNNMDAFLNQVREILDTGSAAIGSFDIEQVEISAQITTDGKIALMGSGVSVGGRGGLKFILKRTSDK